MSVWTLARCRYDLSLDHADRITCYRFLYLIKARARRGRAPPRRRGLPPVFAPAGRARRRAACMRAKERNPAVAGAAGSTTLGSHHGASLEDHGPNVVL